MVTDNETVADIVHMMRDARNLDPSAIEDRNHLLSDWHYDDECQGWLSSYADRIEAAHEREIEKLKNHYNAGFKEKLALIRVRDELRASLKIAEDTVAAFIEASGESEVTK